MANRNDNIQGFGRIQEMILNATQNITKRNEQSIKENGEKIAALNSGSNSYLDNLDNLVKQNTHKMRNEYGVDKDAPTFVRTHVAEKIEAETKNPSKSSLVTSTIEEVSETKALTEKNSRAIAEEESIEEQVIPVVPLLDKKKIRGLADTLKERVFGQEPTINKVVNVLKVAALDIKINEAKPAGCYFFAGPSGVGKTELAQSMADQLAVPLLKINMGEYGQEQDVSKLIGTAKGLVGYKEGGLLTNFVKKNPSCIVLFDEIEKADPSINKILLSIMDHGVCGANDGTEVIFKNTIVISTSNIGASIEYRTDLNKEAKDEYRMAEIKNTLSPEIINRYDAIFHFNALSLEIYKMVSNKFLTKLGSSMLEKHGFELKFSPALVDFMVEKSFDPAMGGRPARKFIESIVIQPLADYMLDEEFETIAKEHKEITMDLNKHGKIFFKGKNRKILGTLQNTEELVAEFEASKFTEKSKETPNSKPIKIR